MFAINPAYRSTDFVRKFQSHYGGVGAEPFEEGDGVFWFVDFTNLSVRQFTLGKRWLTLLWVLRVV
jgi:hypothetical protein